MKEDVPRFYLMQDIMPDILNKLELWATFSVLNQSKYKMKIFIKSIPYLREISRILDLSQELPYECLVDLIAEKYYDRFYMTDLPSRYKDRLNEFNQFLTENSLMLNPLTMISLLKKKGIRNFQYMFGNAISMTDIICMSDNSMKHFPINISHVISSIVDDFATYISENFNGGYSFERAYDEAQYYLYRNAYHKDFANFIHLYYRIQKDIFDFTNHIVNSMNENIIEDSLSDENIIEDSLSDENIIEDSLSDVVLPQDINVNILYDKDLILIDECYICSNAQVNIQLKCMHTLCDHCIDSMIQTVKSDRRNCLRCPFCKADIKDIVTNIENKVT